MAKNLFMIFMIKDKEIINMIKIAPPPTAEEFAML